MSMREKEAAIREYIRVDSERIATRKRSSDQHPLDEECVRLWQCAINVFGGGREGNNLASDALYALRGNRPMPEARPIAPAPASALAPAPQKPIALAPAPQKPIAPQKLIAPASAPQKPIAPQSAPLTLTTSREGVSKRMSDPRIPSPGTKIYNKDKHDRVRAEATIHEDGVEYAGTLYRTLSAAGFAAATALGDEPKAIGGFVFWGLGKK